MVRRYYFRLNTIVLTYESEKPVKLLMFYQKKIKLIYLYAVCIYFFVFFSMLIYCGLHLKEQPMILFILTLTSVILVSVVGIAALLIKRLLTTQPDMLRSARTRIATATLTIAFALIIKLAVLTSFVDKAGSYSLWKYN